LVNDNGPVNHHRRLRRSLVFVPVTLVVALAVSTPTASSAPGRPAQVMTTRSTSRSVLTVGTQVLKQCADSPVAYCGKLRVPLNWETPSSPPDISVCFTWRPATDTQLSALGTVVPVEGGPGYPSSGSVVAQGLAGYYAMYGALLARYDMLTVDLRGTGCSTPLDCPALQDYSGPTGTTAFQAVVGACGAALNRRWKASSGTYVHASDLFTSAPAADDLAAVVEALDLGAVNLYGDSYGSWFAQVFAARFPDLVRSLTLDSTYQVLGLDPWYRTSIEAMPLDFDLACSQSPQCAATGGSAWAQISALAARLRAAPVSGNVPGPSGNREHVTMGVEGLVNLVSDAAEDPYIYRGLDGAAGALLDEDDAAPLLRLYAQRLAFDELYFEVRPSEYSVDLYMAVSCLDYPQLFDMSSSPSGRRRQLAAAEATLPASTFAPFTTKEWLAVDQNTEAFTSCLDWPAPEIAQPPVATPAPLLPPDMPVLILGSQLDTWTPPAGVPEVEDELGADSRFVLFNGATHVVGESYDPIAACASSIIDQFVMNPASLQTIDASCAADLPNVRGLPVYPSSLAAVPPLTETPASTMSVSDLQLVAAAVMTAGDAVARYAAIFASHDDGLYGGTARFMGGTIELSGDELVPGVGVSGTVRVRGADQLVTAKLTAASSIAGVGPTTLVASWPDFGSSATATVTASFDDMSLTGTMPAP
jgi:pimeloyl-ACP methyl ester carboxylesterase